MYGDNDKCKGNLFFAYNGDRKFYIMKEHLLPQWEIQFYSLPPILPSFSQEIPWDILFFFWNRTQCFISEEFCAQRKNRMLEAKFNEFNLETKFASNVEM